MAADDVISIKGQVLKYTYIPTGIGREFLRFGVDFDQKGYLSGIVGGGPVTIYSSGQTVFSFPHIQGITLIAVEDVDEVCLRSK